MFYGPVRNAFDAGSIYYCTLASGGGWALEIESFLDPVKWHRADRRVPFEAKKTRTFLDFFSFRLISSSTCRAHKELWIIYSVDNHLAVLLLNVASHIVSVT
jgi:hypothetical protein